MMASMLASACEALSCGARGVCDPIFGRCVCQAGWVGAQCDELAHDEEEAEEEQKARWPYYKPDWQVQHDRRRLEVVPLHC